MTAEVLRHLRDGGLVFTFGATTTRVCVCFVVRAPALRCLCFSARGCDRCEYAAAHKRRIHCLVVVHWMFASCVERFWFWFDGI